MYGALACGGFGVRATCRRFDVGLEIANPLQRPGKSCVKPQHSKSASTANRVAPEENGESSCLRLILLPLSGMGSRDRLRRYFGFYWPLALTGSIGLSGMLVKNFILLSFEDGVHELALYALAWSVFLPVQSATWMVSQAVNVLVGGRESLASNIRFFGGVVLALTLPLVWLGFSASGADALAHVYSVDEARIGGIQLYLRWFCPLPFILTALQFIRGLLIQVEATKITTALEAGRIVLLIVSLWGGYQLGWSPLLTLVVGQLATDGLNLALHLRFLLPYRAHWQRHEPNPVRFRGILRFFWPVALTTLMFSFSRPILFSFITAIPPGDMPDGISLDTMISGLSLAFGFIPVFMNPINQFRNVFVNFARADLAGVVMLLRLSIAGFTIIMLGFALSGLDGLFFRHLQGASRETQAIGEEAFLVACALPIIMGWRNYYHGLALAHRRTTSMGIASITRNITVYAASAVLLEIGHLNATTAMAAMLCGFASEVVWMNLMTARWRRALPSRDPD